MTKSLLVAPLMCVLLLSACNRAQRTQAVLPDHEVRGVESSSFSLYARSGQGATNALGQIFLPPAKHQYLVKVEFYGRRSVRADASPQINIKLRISPWLEDRLGLPVLWESEPLQVSNGFKR